MRARLPVIPIAVALFVLTIPAFVNGTGTVISFVRLHRGIKSAVALFTLLPLTGGFIVLMLAPAARLRTARTPIQYWTRLLGWTALVLLLYPGIEIIRMIILLPVVGGDLTKYFALRPAASLIAAVGGLVLGSAAFVRRAVLLKRQSGGNTAVQP